MSQKNKLTFLYNDITHHLIPLKNKNPENNVTSARNKCQTTKGIKFPFYSYDFYTSYLYEAYCTVKITIHAK